MGAGAGQYRRRGLRGFLAEADGAASAEYALIIVIIGMGLGVAAWGLAGAVSNSLTWAGAQIASLGGDVEAGSPASPALPHAAARQPPPAAAAAAEAKGKSK